MSEKPTRVPAWLAMGVGACASIAVLKVAALAIPPEPHKASLDLVEWECTAEERAALIATSDPVWTWTRVRDCAQWTRADLAAKQKRRK